MVTSLTLANPPSTLVYKIRDFMIDSPTSKYHGSTMPKATVHGGIGRKEYQKQTMRWTIIQEPIRLFKEKIPKVKFNNQTTNLGKKM